MLSSAPKKIKPFNDAEFVKRAAGRGPKAFLWSYDDDKAWKGDLFVVLCIFGTLFLWMLTIAKKLNEFCEFKAELNLFGRVAVYFEVNLQEINASSNNFSWITMI